LIFDIQRYSIQDGPGIRTTVFFKGCPLRCAWCQNPESQNAYPELMFGESLCVCCYRCVEACPTGATQINDNGEIEIDRMKCRACGECVQVCQSDARRISGKVMSVEEVLGIVKRDELFYRNSGGGVTASGGESTQQPEFLKELFQRCHECGIDTALDTCGYVKWEVLEPIIEHVDLFLFDIKAIDTELHKRFTGVGNTLILDNARRIATMDKAIIIRVPIIRGYNDSDEHIKAVAEFMQENGLKRLDLMSYQQLGEGKYEQLGRKCSLRGTQLFDEEEIEAIRENFAAYGLDVGV